MSVAQMRYIIKRISNRTEFNKEIHPNQLRHSYATHLMNNGAPIGVIQSLMEHEKSEITRSNVIMTLLYFTNAPVSTIRKDQRMVLSYGNILSTYHSVTFFITAISLPNLSPLSINLKLEYKLCAPNGFIE